MVICVIIPASGIGKRSSLTIPKQFYIINNRPILYHTCSIFNELDNIGEIIVGVREEWENKTIAYLNNLTKCKVIIGGNTRHETIKKCVQFLDKKKTDIVIVHDAVRPLIDKKIINDIIDSGIKNEASSYYTDLISTIITCDKKKNFETSLIRNNFYASHTPQVFSYDCIDKMYKSISKIELSEGTECLALAKKYANIKAKLLKGDNFKLQKITYKTDMQSIELFLKIRSVNIVLITGGSSGIGLETVKKLNFFNFKIILCARNLDKLKKIKKLFPLVDIQKCDISISSEIINLFKYIKNQYTRLDILINNAGIAIKKNLIDLTVKEINNTINTNFIGAFLCVQEAFKIMKNQPNKNLIINIGSSSINRGRQDLSIYTCSKAALSSLTDSIAIEGKKYNIFSIEIIPKRTNTNMRSVLFPKENKKDLLNPTEVAEAILNIILHNHTIISGSKLWLK